MLNDDVSVFQMRLVIFFNNVGKNVENYSENKDQNKISTKTINIFLDVRKAFDIVNHELLLKMLFYVGINKITHTNCIWIHFHYCTYKYIP
jgi:hypothetical protein